MDFRGLVWKRVWKMIFFGLKLGMDLENRVAHPHQEFPGVPTRELVPGYKERRKKKSMCRWIPNYGLQLYNEEKKKIIRIQIQTFALLYLYFEKNLQWIKKRQPRKKRARKSTSRGALGSVNFRLLFLKPAGIRNFNLALYQEMISQGE